jgi:hypothetical protein
MYDKLSFQQLCRLIWELETVSVREFISTFKSSNLDSAFENFDRAQKLAETERFFLNWDAALTVAERVAEEIEREDRESGGSKLD